MSRTIQRRDREDWIEEARRALRIARAVELEDHREAAWRIRVRAHAEALAELLDSRSEPDEIVSLRADARYRTVITCLESWESE